MFIIICELILIFNIPQGLCTEIAFFSKSERKYLENHVIKTEQSSSETECGLHCVSDKSCASVNYKTSGFGKGRCELNDKTVREVPDKETHNPEFIHLGIVKRVSKLYFGFI